MLGLTSISSPPAKNRSKPQSVAYNQDDSIQTEQQYWALLSAADESTFQHEFEPGFLLLLDDHEKKNYSQLPSLAARKSFIVHYWKSRNPNPLLPENDRLLDHLRRCAYAREQFAMVEPPYFDDRGKYHIKYGKPLQRLQDIGGLRRLPESRVMIDLNLYSVKENESWSYVNIAPNFVVHFVKDGQTFHEVPSLKDAIIGNQRRGLLVWYWGDLLKKRFWMSPAINETVTQIEALETELVVRNRGRTVRLGSSGISDRQIVRRLLENLERADYAASEASLDAPATTYHAINALNKLSFSEDIAQFRGPEGQTRVEVTVRTPLKNYVDHLDSLTTDTVRIEYACLLRDQSFDSLTGARLQRYFPVKSAALENLPFAIGCMTMLTSPRESELALQVKNEQNGELGFSLQALKIRDFSGRDLMMSDIQFFAGVTNTNQRQVLPVFERQNVMVVPYPYEELRKSVSLFCYFELYNLQSAGLGREYTVTYKVSRNRGRQGIFKRLSSLWGGRKEVSMSMTDTQSIIADNANQLIALDIRNLPAGAYRLEVIVSGIKNKITPASAQKDFMIID
ncbi:MAG: GWxTD domain-containing protein [candidate division KSB1 bacterium]|nr:GWxTD domain-containing protein [candidate division KSB1 bacterium]MDZ7304649.1 GWxTD domain-containing protein [candidate division KSB1 bacterium]MDZ7313781.1 GWxTD domain-containing protein [candidate division KSB1 bacterium]